MVAKWLMAAFLVVVAADGGAQAPAGQGGGGATKRCLESQPCVVTVSVPAPCNACTPSAAPAYASIEKGKKLRITWKLATPNYAFDSQKGIRFADDPNGDEFKCRAEQDATVYVCDDRHSTSGKTYKYTINLTGPGTPKPLDPWIINE